MEENKINKTKMETLKKIMDEQETILSFLGWLHMEQGYYLGRFENKKFKLGAPALLALVLDYQGISGFEKLPHEEYLNAICEAYNKHNSSNTKRKKNE